MPSEKSEEEVQETEDTSTETMVAVLENNENGGDAMYPKPIGWNIDDQSEVTHKIITDRFAELLNLIENYTKIVEKKEKPALKLKRTQSEQLISKRDDNDDDYQSNLTKVSASLMEISSSTLMILPKPKTCETGSQTTWDLIDGKIMKKLKSQAGGGKHIKPSKMQQHTIHIEVESVTSSSALRRAPLRQRLWQVVTQAGDTLVACTYMIGENFTYILFIVLCLWCLYLVIGHYYSFLRANVDKQMELKRELGRMRALPK